jgi:hypothetical protein
MDVTVVCCHLMMKYGEGQEFSCLAHGIMIMRIAKTKRHNSHLNAERRVVEVAPEDEVVGNNEPEHAS